MVVSCEEVWREISNYLEGELDPNLRAAMAEHLRECKHCTAVLDGTRNVVQLYGDERMFEVPAGFSGRLHRKLESAMPRPRGGAFGWMVAFAAAAVLLISFEVGSSSAFTRLQLRSEHAQPAATPIPPDMMALDIGPQTVELFSEEISRARTILWNGPMGVFEVEPFSHGTMKIAHALAENVGATSIVGGGDTIAAVREAEVTDRITHISTGGGASLEFLEGKKLPGVEALTDAA